MSDKQLRDAIILLVKRHARTDSDKVLSCLRIKWNQVGHDLSINGYAVEYKDKPKMK